jgi:hypothetical protein
MAGLSFEDDAIRSTLRLDTARGLALVRADVIFIDEHSMVSMGSRRHSALQSTAWSGSSTASRG